MKYRIIITLILLLILGGLVVVTSDNTSNTPSQTATKMAPSDKTTQSLKDLKLN